MSTEQALHSWLEGLVPPNGLPRAQRRVADTIGGHQRLASFADLSEIATRAGVDASTVVRCAQSLGFRGWPDLQQELRARYLAGLTSEQTLEEHSGGAVGPVHEAIRRDLGNLQRALGTISADAVDAVVAVLAGADRILVASTGSATAPATVLTHLGSTMGYPISGEGRGGVHLATALTGLGEGDVLVVLNIWRPMRELLAAVRVARAAGVTVVALTDMRRGPLGALADHALVVPSEGVSFFQSTTAATSVVYGLLAGMQAARPDETRRALRRTQQLWDELDTYAD